ncbi:MAG TPA: indole-3-glycerol phosphate synthase TrpC [Nitrolancea sp.]|jgi:indole-3-glycerol phosphate synthase|nr:indole-3-glycerol phosphate synthase TrpC [Nitrolancea sp.]
MSIRTGTFLDRIVAQTLIDLPARKQSTPLAKLERNAAERAPAVSFERALRVRPFGVIAEVKRASPSKGPIAAGVDAAEVARDYVAAGASAISVLTDGPFFSGNLADLQAVAEVAHEADAPLPVLRKDFLVDPYQVLEARAFGADAVLLIVSLLSGSTLGEMLGEVHSLGMQALVEIHDEVELDAALNAGARVIGINNRDLRTFKVDLATTERLAPRVPQDRTVVAESGIHGREDARRLAAAGAHALLIGESLMLASDRGAAIRELRS